MGFVLTVETLESLYAESDAAAAVGDRERAESRYQEAVALVDKATVARTEGREAIVEALELAAHLAVEEDFAALAADCAARARAGDFGVALLVALRQAIAAAQPVMMPWGLADEDGHSRRIMENGLRAMTRLRIVHPLVIAPGIFASALWACKNPSIGADLN